MGTSAFSQTEIDEVFKRVFPSLANERPFLSEGQSLKSGSSFSGVTIKFRKTSLRESRSLSPGPGTYTVPNTIGAQGSRKPSIRARHAANSRLAWGPGPGARDTRVACGKHRPAYTMSGRGGLCSRSASDIGPGEYNIKGDFDRYHTDPIGWVPPFCRSR